MMINKEVIELILNTNQLKQEHKVEIIKEMVKAAGTGSNSYWYPSYPYWPSTVYSESPTLTTDSTTTDVTKDNLYNG